MDEELYERINASQINVGDEVIVERRRWSYRDGKPLPSYYYRTIAIDHKTVAGKTRQLVAMPNLVWPQIPAWSLGWIYAGNTATEQMWRKK